MAIHLGNHLWDTCADCGKLVKLTGWLRGIHLCLTPEELAQRRIVGRVLNMPVDPSELRRG